MGSNVYKVALWEPVMSYGIHCEKSHYLNISKLNFDLWFDVYSSRVPLHIWFIIEMQKESTDQVSSINPLQVSLLTLLQMTVSNVKIEKNNGL